MPSSAESVQDFFAYLRRRRMQMVSGGVLLVLAGAASMYVAHGADARIWLSLPVLIGAALIFGAFAARAALRDAPHLAAGEPRLLELQSWPYRTARSTRPNRVLVTLDLPDSTSRAPLVEFKAVWFTPGSAELPRRTAQVFGSLARGSSVLAVAEDGSCFLGRVRASRLAEAAR